MKTALFKGDSFSDTRGKLLFFNTFTMQEIVRFYQIEPDNSDVIRGWQAHKQEKKWFYCIEGGFEINLIKVDDFETPNINLESEKYFLDVDVPIVLAVPKGYATAFKAIDNNSKLIVYSNFTLEQSKNDDYRFSLNTFKTDWKNY